MRKLNYRVVFPFELKLRNTSDDCSSLDDCYDLFAVVVHVGQGPNHGELSGHIAVLHVLLDCSEPIFSFSMEFFGARLKLSAYIDACGRLKRIASR